MLQSVFFDMDGLMFDTERLGREGWQHAAAQLGVDIPEKVIAQMRGTGVERCRQIFNRSIPGGLYDKAHEIRLAYAEKQIDRNGVPVKSGLRELLEYLRQENIPAVLATSTGRERAERYLELTGVRDYFTAAVYGPEVKHPKPAPDIFLAAATAVGAAPVRCLVLEDSPNGLRAAKAAGCWTVVVPRPDPRSSSVGGAMERKSRKFETGDPFTEAI